MDVLPVDLDPQGNLSDYFGIDRYASPTIRDVLIGEARAGDAIHRGMIPANLELAEAELSLTGRIGRELTLKRALEQVQYDYDFILIDCPPAISLLTINALVASSHVLISSEAEYFSFRGVEQVLEVVRLTREWLNDRLDLLGVVVNLADMGTHHAQRTWRHLRESFGPKLFETVIRRSIRYPESAKRRLSILDYKPKLGADYIRLASELLGRLGEEEARERVWPLQDELAA
jgi:chromosome partitioning protein